MSRERPLRRWTLEAAFAGLSDNDFSHPVKNGYSNGDKDKKMGWEDYIKKSINNE